MFAVRRLPNFFPQNAIAVTAVLPRRV